MIELSNATVQQRPIFERQPNAIEYSFAKQLREEEAGQALLMLKPSL